MPQCSFVPEKKGHQKPKRCSELATTGDFCDKHQPKTFSVAPTPVTLSWYPKPDGGGTTVNTKFQTACDEIEAWIQNTCDGGIQPGGMPFKGTGNKGPHSLLHNTQPRSNSTVFYKWVGSGMEVFGVGGHAESNTTYSLTWYDGSSARVDLKAKTIK